MNKLALSFSLLSILFVPYVIFAQSSIKNPTVTVISPTKNNYVIARGGSVSINGPVNTEGFASALVNSGSYSGDFFVFISKSSTRNGSSEAIKYLVNIPIGANEEKVIRIPLDSVPQYFPTTGQYYFHAVFNYKENGNIKEVTSRSPFSFSVVDLPLTLSNAIIPDLGYDRNQGNTLPQWNISNSKKVGWTMTYGLDLFNPVNQISDQTNVDITACGRKKSQLNDSCYAVKTKVPNIGYINNVKLPTQLEGHDYAYLMIRANMPNGKYLTAQTLPFKPVTGGGSVSSASADSSSDSQLASVLQALQLILGNLSK